MRLSPQRRPATSQNKAASRPRRSRLPRSCLVCVALDAKIAWPCSKGFAVRDDERKRGVAPPRPALPHRRGRCVVSIGMLTKGWGCLERYANSRPASAFLAAAFAGRCWPRYDSGLFDAGRETYSWAHAPGGGFRDGIDNRAGVAARSSSSKASTDPRRPSLVPDRRRHVRERRVYVAAGRHGGWNRESAEQGSTAVACA